MNDFCAGCCLFCRNGEYNLDPTPSCCSPFELRGLFAFPKHPEVVFYSKGRAKTWLLTQTVVLCLKSSQKGFFKDCPLEGDPSLPPTSPHKVPTAPCRCQHGPFADAWQKFQGLLFLLSVTQKGKWDIRKVCWRGSQASYQFQGVELCTEGRSLPFAVSLQSASSLLAFDAESPSQTGWRTGLSVLDLVHPTQLKSRECFSSAIPERRMLTACLSAACSRRQWLAAIQDRPLLWAKRVCKEKRKGQGEAGRKGNETCTHQVTRPKLAWQPHP